MMESVGCMVLSMDMNAVSAGPANVSYHMSTCGIKMTLGFWRLASAKSPNKTCSAGYIQVSCQPKRSYLKMPFTTYQGITKYICYVEVLNVDTFEVVEDSSTDINLSHSLRAAY